MIDRDFFKKRGKEGGREKRGDVPLRTSSIGTDDDGVSIIEVLPDVSECAWFSVQVVDGDVEETLDLTGVKIHRDHVVAPRCLEHVGDQFG